MDGTVPGEGLRERKKRQTKQFISDVATGLILERGFEDVTMAQIAEAADVSVNTVYNYFPDKADLFFDRGEDVVDRLAGVIRNRAPGESAVAAVLRSMRTELDAVSPALGLVPGFSRFMRVCHASPSLSARLWRMQQQAQDRVARTLYAETRAAADDLMPELVAGQIAWIQNTVMNSIGRAMVAEDDPAGAARAARAKVDAMEGLLSPPVLNYATKDTG
jgi:AcrR family transcriptional regulator